MMETTILSNQHLEMTRNSIFATTELSTITYVYTPTLRATHIESSDVATSGANNLTIKSGSTNFMAFNVSDGINNLKPLFF